jgi:hypothetical protein
MIRRMHLALAAIGAIVGISLLAPMAARAAILKTVADAEVGERPAEDRGANATSVNIRTITTPVTGNRNELVVMRFDLATVDLNNVTAATLNLIWHRDNTTTRPWVLYGVNDGAVGGDNNGMTPGFDDNSWDEASVRMSTMPGLIYDGDSTTQGVSATATVNLGTGNFVAATKGAAATFGAAGLLGFLSGHPDDLVTLILATPSTSTATGQDRFASKEATSLDGGTPTGAAGDFAPYLDLTIVPEPASTTLAVLAVLGLLGVKRRRG